jgi:hypothetical protein
MTNADKFKNIFGLYATELWSMPEKDFLKWLNGKVLNCSEIPNNWIPCSEKLPEEGEVVLTQAKFKDDMKMAVSSRIDYNYWTGWGTRDINIIAWMPLPEPYKGE